LSRDASPTVRGMAVWALSRLMTKDEFERFASSRIIDEDADVETEWAMAGVA